MGIDHNCRIDTQWMDRAYQLAIKAKKESEVPIGAVLVNENNEVIGEGWNQVIQLNDPSAHAEVLAIRKAAKFSKNYRLNNTTLYVTLEPCTMCASLIVHARIKRLVFACRDVKTGACGSVFNLLKGYPLNHKVIIDEGILEKECSELLIDFFKKKRTPC